MLIVCCWDLLDIGDVLGGDFEFHCPKCVDPSDILFNPIWLYFVVLSNGYLHSLRSLHFLLCLNQHWFIFKWFIVAQIPFHALRCTTSLIKFGMDLFKLFVRLNLVTCLRL